MEQLLKKLGKGKADPASRQQAQTVRSSVKGFAKQRTVSSCVKHAEAALDEARHWFSRNPATVCASPTRMLEGNLMKPIDPTQLRGLSAAILSDVMDSLGLTRRAMKPFVRPLDDELVLVGRARTGLYMSAFSLRDGENPYEVEIALVDDLKPGDVVVLACNGPTDRIAPWGELLSTASVARKAAGCVTDGLVRDVKQIRAMKFPVFHGGIGPLDTKGRARMVDRDVRVECGGVSIDPGDIVFGDVDGVVVIPHSHEALVIEKASEKVTGENNTRDALRKGEPLAAVFKRLGIL